MLSSQKAEKMRRLGSILVLASLCIGVFVASAMKPVQAASTVRNVGYGADKGDCTANPCLTINYAVSQSSPGDQINVKGGTYTEMVTVSKAVSIFGSNGATVDASGKDNGFLIQGDAAAGTIVQGFTVKNATQEGILAKMTSNVRILNNTVTNNDLGANKPGATGECATSGNVPGDCGEGIHLWSVMNSLVDGNTVTTNQGGILLTDEDGPTARNMISKNNVTNNTPDCGVTLASHILNIGSPVAASKGGVYANQIINNTITGNGEGGVGIFAAPPGAADYANVVSGNTITGNGYPGVTLHSHAPFQNLNDNVITDNVITGGLDEDSGVMDLVGVMVFADVSSGAKPISSISINNNSISKAKYGVYFSGTTQVFDVSSNQFAVGVAKDPGSAKVGSAAGGAPPAAAAAPAITSAPVAVATAGFSITPPSTGDAGLEAN